MENKCLFLLIICILMFAVSCKDDDNDDDVLGGPGVYIAGSYINDGTDIGNACYWKNGELIDLDSGGYHSYAVSVFVSGNDVYVCGKYRYDDVNDLWTICYWRNGERIDIVSGYDDTSVDDIIVSGNDIYICGQVSDAGGNETAYYWKNGVSTVLNSDGEDASTTNLYVSGDDVYVSGYYYETDTYVGSTHDLIPCMWITDGTKYDLDAGAEDYTVATGIYLNESDIYICGYFSSEADDEMKACYWDDTEGAFTQLDSGGEESYPSAIFILNNDIYIGGAYYTGSVWTACYWQNGVLIEALSASYNMAESIFVTSNGTVYMCGYLREGFFPDEDSKACYWLNNEIFFLEDNGSTAAGAESIFVVE
jgi:hypothetical protein